MLARTEGASRPTAEDVEARRAAARAHAALRSRGDGQEVTGSAPHLDLYYATQDNDIKASADGGTTWTGSRCCEGFHLRVAPTSASHDGTRLTGAACGGCGTFQSREHLQGQAAWPNARRRRDAGRAGSTAREGGGRIGGTPYLQPANPEDTPLTSFTG